MRKQIALNPQASLLIIPKGSRDVGGAVPLYYINIADFPFSWIYAIL